MERENIKAVLVRYATALDMKDWDLLDKVFKEDVVVNYNNAPTLYGRQAVKKAIREYIDNPVATQHFLGNFVIEEKEAGLAYSVCQVQAFHADTKRKNAFFTLYGRYEDVLEKTKAGWLIAKRRLFTTATIGGDDIIGPIPD